MTDINNNNPSQRFTAYRAVIPFYILYDLDLNANHLRLYGQIEQMESNPDPSVSPTFSYAWMAKQLGIARRNVITIANALRKKGYIHHIEIEPGKWFWTTRKPVIHTHDASDGGDPEGHQGGDPVDHRGSDPEDHLKIPKDKIPKDNNKSSISPLKNKSSKTSILETLKENNPHQISEELISEWKTIRKKPITERVWKKTNEVLTALTLKGLNAIEAFELMLEKQWQGMEVRYFDAELAARNPSKPNQPKPNGNDALSRVINKYTKNDGVTYDQYGNTCFF